MIEQGTVDLQERIQVQAPSTDLAYMIKRLKLGDSSVLTTKQPLYGDFTQFPTDGSELVNTLLHAEYAFNQLPDEERKDHGYDYRSWLSSIFNPVAKPVEKPIEKPVDNTVEKPIEKPIVSPLNSDVKE